MCRKNYKDDISFYCNISFHVQPFAISVRTTVSVNDPASNSEIQPR